MKLRCPSVYSVMKSSDLIFFSFYYDFFPKLQSAPLIRSINLKSFCQLKIYNSQWKSWFLVSSPQLKHNLWCTHRLQPNFSYSDKIWLISQKNVNPVFFWLQLVELESWYFAARSSKKMFSWVQMPQDIIELRSTLWPFFSLYLLPHCVPTSDPQCVSVLSVSWLSDWLCSLPVFLLVRLPVLLQLGILTLPVDFISLLPFTAVGCLLSCLNNFILFLVWRVNTCPFFFLSWNDDL